MNGCGWSVVAAFAAVTVACGSNEPSGVGGGDCELYGQGRFYFDSDEQLRDAARSGCTEMAGLHLGGGVTNVDGFEHVKSLESLQIDESRFDSLEGLSGLERVTGDVTIVGTSSLSTLRGLENLRSIGGRLLIFDTGISSLEGLGGLREVKEIELARNEVLASLDGLDAAFTGESTSLTIQRSPTLASLAGLRQATEIAALRIEETGVTSMQGLENLTSLPGGLILRNNAQLTSLRGLEGLTQTEHVVLTANTRLDSLAGLENVESTRELAIALNDSLASLSPIDRWSPGTVRERVAIGQNPALPQCEVDQFFASQHTPEEICTVCRGNAACE